MALKDWKKIGIDKWKKIGKIYELEIVKSNNKIPYLVILSIEMYGEENVLEQLKTKKDALKFAKAYMRTH